MPTTLDQNIELRLALPDDIPSINEIRQHSLVAPHQYRISYPLWLEIWLTRLNADISAESFEWRITAVLFDSKIVGHISEGMSSGSAKRSSMFWSRVVGTVVSEACACFLKFRFPFRLGDRNRYPLQLNID